MFDNYRLFRKNTWFILFFFFLIFLFLCFYIFSKNQAKKVAAGANTNGSPINEVDQYNGKPKKGYYYHWHPYKRTPKAHAFYGNPVK